MMYNLLLDSFVQSGYDSFHKFHHYSNRSSPVHMLHIVLLSYLINKLKYFSTNILYHLCLHYKTINSE